ncbi:CHAT domain-containing protein, partial [candidate division KSB1 bacterium]|nr:CHAT domain-containing protein [candidate division KSB1 bacterium]
GFVLPSLGLAAGYLATKFYLDRTKPRPIQYKNFTLHVQKKSGTTFLVDVIESPEGQVRDGEFVFEKDEAEEFLNKLRADEANQEEMRAFGKELFNKLFQPAISRCYDKSRGRIQEKSSRLRINLMIESPALVTLPWELMYDPSGREYLALTRELSLVRFLMTKQEKRALTVEPPLKVLVASANPNGHAFLPGIEEEKRRIREALHQHMRAGHVKLDFLPNLTVQALSEKLEEGYHVLHYSGHGTFQESAQGGEGCLIFENESGDAEPVNTARLELLLRDSEVRLVILNACQTAQTSRFDYFMGSAQALVSAGLPAVIAMQHKIFDDSGVVFAESFYRSLAEQFQIDMAVQAARKVLAVRSKVEKMDWGTPVLFMRSSNGVILSDTTP